MWSTRAVATFFPVFTIKSLTSKGNVLDGALSLAGTQEKRILNGPISYTPAGGTKSTLDYKAVGMVKGACYPSEGSLAVASPAFTGTVTFTSSTPATGIVQVKIGNLPAFPANLPAYGNCPSGQ